MSQAAIRQVEPGVLALDGVLDYSSGPFLREQGKVLIGTAQAKELVIDCARVAKSTSVGLSLLLAFMRDAKAVGKRLKVRAMPQDMYQIAQVCGLLELIPLEG